MKLKYLVAPLLFAAAAVTGCQETAETYPAIYMTDAQSNPDKSMTIDEPPGRDLDHRLRLGGRRA